MREIGIGLIGAGFMGKSHSFGYRTMPLLFSPPPLMPRLELLATSRAETAEAGAGALGFGRWTADWRALVDDPAVEIVDVSAYSHVRKPMVMAAIAAGKHIYAEKPLGLSAADSQEMTEAAERAGIKTLVGYNFLKNPAIDLAQRLVADGTIGAIRAFHGQFNADFLADPAAPMNWRCDRTIAGHGALGDIASHVLMFALTLAGPIAAVQGSMQTFVQERDVAPGGPWPGPRARVTNEDQVQFLIRFANGAGGLIEASRVATGAKLHLGFTLTGSRGALAYDNRRMNELQLYRADDDPAVVGFRTVLANPEHRWFSRFVPLAGFGLGYNDGKVIEVFELLDGIARDRPLYPDFRAAWQVDRVIEAVARSASAGRWVEIAEI